MSAVLGNRTVVVRTFSCQHDYLWQEVRDGNSLPGSFNVLFLVTGGAEDVSTVISAIASAIVGKAVLSFFTSVVKV